MNKDLLVKILVVFLAGLFVLEPFAMTMGSWVGNGEEASSEYYVGTANVNMTIYGYGAFLYVQGPTQLQLTQIRGNPEVLNIEDAGNSVYRITLRDSAKTREVFGEFEEMGISTLAIAQIGLPDQYDLILADGSSISISGGYVQLAMPPAAKPGSRISYMLEVKSDGKTTLDVTNAQSYTYEVELEIPGVIENSTASRYEFQIPWEKRLLGIEELNEEYGEDNVEYSQNDYIIFEPELSMEETLMLKREYMTYISSSSATVLPNFTDSALVEFEFEGRATLPNSSLAITSDEIPDVEYEYSAIRNYAVSIPSNVSGYYIAVNSVNITSEDEFAQGDSVVLKTVATVTGDMLLAIREISLEEA